MLKNWSYLNKICVLFQVKQILVMFYLLIPSKIVSQVNAVGNPSFEDYYSCSLPNYVSRAKYWNSIDSAKLGYAGKYFNTCLSNVPSNANTFQYPRTGNAYILGTQFCATGCSPPVLRQYPKNRLIVPLISGKTYCVKMYVSIANTSPYGNDAFGMYFTNSSIDTTSQCGLPLTYLTPQVKNPTGNIIIDTLNWIEVSGTYTATGNEIYLVLGNFISDGSVNKTFINGTFPGIWTDVAYDDVSVIDFNLAAYAGPDKNINLGDSAFIGRPPEIGLECTWSSGTVSIGSGGGIWVKPPSAGTYSYIVTQNICGLIKKDTVNVNVSPGFVSENELFSQSIRIYPQPAKDLLNISLNYFYEKRIEIKIIDVTGREIERKELLVENSKAQLGLGNISEGVYTIQMGNLLGQTAQKRLVITR